jgi:hypothetical protein
MTDNLAVTVIAGFAAGISLIIAFSIFSTSSISSISTVNSTSYIMQQMPSTTATIFPGSSIYHPCPFQLSNNFAIINSTGFGIYNVSTVTDYVIPPAHQGSLTYSIQRSDPSRIISSGPLDIPAKQTFDNLPFFAHYEKVTEYQNVTDLGPVTLPNGTIMESYQACYKVGNGTACGGGPTKERPANTVTFGVMNNTHPGISISADPANETLAFNQTQIVKLTFSIASDAPQGTYWLEFSPGICGGSPTVYFTVGNKPYSASNVVDYQEYSNP